MKISINTLAFINQHYGSAGHPAPEGVAALVDKIGRQLGAVEEVIDFGKQFEEVIIAKVVSCVDHPNADRLHVCKIDDGRKVPDLERDERGYVTVVCGAPNIREGMLVAWLPPGSTVPATLDSAEPFVLESRPLRGVVSNGMLASPKELGLSDEHDGILEIINDRDESHAPGTYFADAYHLRGDTLIDIENKMFTHRPDCFGYLGIARELEGIAGRPYKSPEWYQLKPDFPGIETSVLPLAVHNELPELVPRFMAIAMSDVQVKPSPMWLQIDLARAGLRPINNIVDYTNFFMLETGQPLHAYDYDKVLARSQNDEAALHIRKPQGGEQLRLLNGKTITPHNDAVLIATDKEPIGLGGIMGGVDTEVDENTTRVILECANFDMYTTRRTAMEHGIFTDAVTRFTKGQSPLQNPAALAKIVDEIRRFAGGKVASAVVDNNNVPEDVLQRGSVHPPVRVGVDFINARLGLSLNAQDMQRLLQNVEFTVIAQDSQLEVTAPFWRTDIEIPEDIVEEIGRLYGYDRLPLELPKRAIQPAPKNTMIAFKQQLRGLLAAAGANEIYAYTFVHGDLMQKTGQTPEASYKLRNALSPGLQYYRLSLTPSLLEKVHPNIKQGYRQFALFELNNVPTPKTADATDATPELPRLAFVYAADAKAAQQLPGAAYYQAKYWLDYVADKLGIELTYQPYVQGALDAQLSSAFEPKRSAIVYADEQPLGIVGEYTASAARAHKLPALSAGFELDTAKLLAASRPHRTYRPLSNFPATEQDVTFKAGANTSYAELLGHIQTALGGDPELSVRVAPLDMYQPEDNAAYKHASFRIRLQHRQKTLSTSEVNGLLDGMAQVVQAATKASRV